MYRPQTPWTDLDPVHRPQTPCTDLDPVYRPQTPWTDLDPVHRPQTPWTDLDPVHKPQNPCADPRPRGQTPDPVDRLQTPCSVAQWRHVHHVLGTRQRQLQGLQQRVADVLEGRDAHGKRKEEDVESGDEAGQRPGNEEEDDEPADGPEEAWAQASCPLPTASFASHGKLHSLPGGSEQA